MLCLLPVVLPGLQDPYINHLTMLLCPGLGHWSKMPDPTCVKVSQAAQPFCPVTTSYLCSSPTYYVHIQLQVLLKSLSTSCLLGQIPILLWIGSRPDAERKKKIKGTPAYLQGAYQLAMTVSFTFLPPKPEIEEELCDCCHYCLHNYVNVCYTELVNSHVNFSTTLAPIWNSFVTLEHHEKGKADKQIMN